MSEAPRVLNARDDPRDRVPSADELRAGGASLGALTRCVRAGSLAAELHGLDDETAALIDDQYAGFVEGAGFVAPLGPRRAARIEVVRSPVSRWLHLSKGEGFVEEARVGARWSDGVELWSYGFAGRFDEGASRGRLLLCEGSSMEAAQAVENYLRFFIAAQALAHGGFLLHSAGVARGGRAWLFFGPSGAGKSTTASLAPADADLLGDDLVLVEPQGGGAWRACGVPFRGSFARGRNAATCAPVTLACRITQSDANALEDAPRVLRITEMLAQVPFLMDEPRARARAADVVEAFIRDVPTKRLRLRRDGTYWALLEQAALS